MISDLAFPEQFVPQKSILTWKTHCKVDFCHNWSDFFIQIYFLLLNGKNYIKLSFIWDQSGICSSNRLAMRASQRKTVTASRRINLHHLRLLILLQIGAVNKLFDLDQWNLDTKNVKHSTLREKQFQTSEMICLWIKA